jgi:hypothetical protein
MKRLIGIVACMMGLTSAHACAGETAPDGGNSNWLRPCDDDADCTSGARCFCGLCTLACSRDDDCTELGHAALCDATSADAWDDRCEAGDPARICTTACTTSTDCPDDLTCRLGSCIPSAARTIPVPDASVSTATPDASIDPAPPPRPDGGADVSVPPPDARQPSEPGDAAGAPLPGIGEPCAPGGPRELDGGVPWVSAPRCHDDLTCDASETCVPVMDCGTTIEGECVFATGDVRAVALDGDTVYWVDYGTFDAVRNYRSDGAVLARTVGNMSVTSLATGLVRPVGIRARAGVVLFALADGSCHLLRTADGGAAQLLADDCDGVFDIADDHAYYRTGGTLARYELASGLEAPGLSSDAGSGVAYVASDATHAYFADHSLWRVAHDSNTMTEVYDSTGIRSIALATDEAVFTTERVVQKVPKNGGDALNVGGLLGWVSNVSVHDEHAYFILQHIETFPRYAAIMSAPLDLGSLQREVVAMTRTPRGYAVGLAGLFWIDESGRLRGRAL